MAVSVLIGTPNRNTIGRQLGGAKIVSIWPTKHRPDASYVLYGKRYLRRTLSGTSLSRSARSRFSCSRLTRPVDIAVTVHLTLRTRQRPTKVLYDPEL